MLYAFPVVVRLVERGIRGVAPNTVEAAGAFGATRLQVLLKVKIPLARDAIMLGVNQGIIMVLAVVVIGGLVGSGALGYKVAQGLQRNEFGVGVVASLAILALGIALDRVTQGKRRASERRTSEMEQATHERGGSDVERPERRWLAGALLVGGGRGRARLASPASAVARTSGANCGKVTLNEQAWAGSTANTYVAKNVLEENSAARSRSRRSPRSPSSRRWRTARSTPCSRTGSTSTQYKQYIDKAEDRRAWAARSASRATSAGSSRST